MFVFEIKMPGGEGKAVLKTDDGESSVKVFLSGDPGFVLSFPEWISNAQGPFGLYLSLEEGIRPNDLAFALAQDDDVSYKLEQGELSEYESAPKGAVS